ncbi:MAG: DUF1127 domain-containing protein [Roseobacter sp.]
MAVDTQTAKSGGIHVIGASIASLAKFRAKVCAASKTFQIARMQSTLSSMSDHQFAQIGISRSDIPKYAETLMAKDYEADRQV